VSGQLTDPWPTIST